MNDTTRAEAMAVLEEGARAVLRGIGMLGVDTSGEDFNDTPRRVARAFAEFVAGADDTAGRLHAIVSTSFPSGRYNEMVVEKDITAVSLCPHHLLPVHYRVTVGYVPGRDGRVLGLSKLARLAHLLAARPVLQETFTMELAQALDSISPAGVGVMVRGEHDCMRSRGVRQQSPVFTSRLTGIMLENPASRAEFLSLAQGR